MYRIDEICDHNGQMEDIYSEFNKWSFESELCFAWVWCTCQGIAVKIWSGMNVLADYFQTLSYKIMERELQISQGLSVQSLSAQI